MIPRPATSSRSQSPFKPFSRNNFFEREVTGLPAAADQTNAKKLANQLNYSNASYSYNGEPAPKFYGYSGVGYSNETGTTVTKANFKEWTPSIWIVDKGVPTQKITLVDSEGKVREAGYQTNLQKYFEAVPLPEASLAASKELTVGGTDKHMCIYRPSTDEMWEMWRYGVWGEKTFVYGAYISSASEWNGVVPNQWGARATGLALIGGIITLQDLVEVAKGGSIKHALALAIPSTGPGWVAPANRSDAGEGKYFGFIAEKHEGVANPAYPFVDAVPEGSWFRFPAGSKPSTYGLTKPLEVAIFEAIRAYGMFVVDAGGGGCQFYVESPLAIESPYAWIRVNPVQGAPFAGGLAWMKESWKDNSLMKMTEEISGSSSCFTNQPWKEIELIEPRSA